MVNKMILSDARCRAQSSTPDAPTKRPLSILALTSELPWPLDTGGHLRSYHLLRALARRFRVRLITAVLPGQEQAVAAVRDSGIDVRPATVGPRFVWCEVVRALSASVRGEPYCLYRRHDRSAVRTVLRQELQRELPDVVYLDHLDSLVFRNELAALPFVMDLHNVYSTLVDRVALERRGVPRLYLRREAKLLQRMESLAAGSADALLTVSESDASHFANLGGRDVRVVPNAVDCAAYDSLPTGRRPGPPILLYVGAMSWAPNVSAARYLASEVLPEIRHRFPETRLRIVGRDPTPEVEALRCLPGVEVTGTVRSMLPHLAEAHALVVPLEAGGGTRLKILEAFAAGLPVVSTPVGCEGLRVEHGEHLLISDREQFAESIFTMLADDQLGAGLAAKARVLVREHYDWAVVSELACAAVADVAITNSRGCFRPKTGTTPFAAIAE